MTMTANSNHRTITLALAAIAAALAIVVEHYAWRAVAFVTGVTWHLDPPWTYVVGVTTIGLFFTAWCALQRARWPIVAFWIIVLATGATDVVVYTVDWSITGQTAAIAGITVLIIAGVAALLITICWLIYKNRLLQRQVYTLRAEKAVLEGIKCRGETR